MGKKKINASTVVQSHDGLHPASKPNELHTRQGESYIK